jgi:hypothetical protein
VGQIYVDTRLTGLWQEVMMAVFFEASRTCDANLGNSVMTITKTLTALTFLMALTPVCAFAIEPAWVGARAGSGGLGGELGVRMTPTLVLLGVIQGDDYSHDQSINGIRYGGELKLGSSGARMDWHPPIVPFFVTAGGFANDNPFALTATPASNVVMGHTSYTPAQMSTLNTKATFDEVACFMGVGLKFELGPLETALEAGVYAQGKPNILYTSTGLLVANPVFQSDIAIESAKMIDEHDAALYRPKVSIQARWEI